MAFFAHVPAKPIGKLLRKVLEPAMAAEVEGLQFGAVAGGGTVFPAHTARLFLVQARLACQSSALLFANLKSAFYSAWPEIALGKILLPAQRQAMFDAAGLSPQQAAEVACCIDAGDTALSRRRVAAVWRQLAADWHRCAHFAVGSGRDAVLLQALTGVLPGNAVADLVFVLLFHMFLKQDLELLDQHGLVAVLQRNATAPFGASGNQSQPRHAADASTTRSAHDVVAAVSQVPVRPSSYMDDLVSC